MDYHVEHKQPLNIMGVAREITRKNAHQEIVAFWSYVQENNLLGFIPNRTDKNCIYAIYTDHSPEDTVYTMILGAEVTSLSDISIPDTMVGRVIPGGPYAIFTVQGSYIVQEVANAWKTIDSLTLQRTYTYDIEVYDFNLLNKQIPEACIRVALPEAVSASFGHVLNN